MSEMKPYCSKLGADIIEIQRTYGLSFLCLVRAVGLDLTPDLGFQKTDTGAKQEAREAHQSHLFENSNLVPHVPNEQLS